MIPVNREITADGRGAALFTRGDSQSLAQKLRLLLHDEDRRQSYGVAGRQLIEQKYSLRGTEQEYLTSSGSRRCNRGEYERNAGSLVIATRNRFGLLRRAISAVAQTLPGETLCELRAPFSPTGT